MSEFTGVVKLLAKTCVYTWLFWLFLLVTAALAIVVYYLLGSFRGL